MKRNVKKKDEKRKTEHAQISQFAPTTSFDFHPNDGNTYLIGTEKSIYKKWRKLDPSIVAPV